MPTVADYLKYADLQMASEALFGSNATLRDAILTPGKTSADPMTEAILEVGNLHATRFTKTEAEKFTKEWKVVEHISNTTTGFSGTLFEKIGTGRTKGVSID